MYLALDLSLKCVGIARFSSDGKLLEKDRFIPSEDLPNCMKIHQITKKLRELFEGVEDLIIEDIYFGLNAKSVLWLARLSGAVAMEWVDYSYRIPYFYPANSARKLVGIKGNAQKAEVQCWVLEKYGWAKKESLAGYKSKITKLKNRKKSKELTSSQFKYRMTKLSENIDEATGISNDVADSIVIGLAYLEDIKQGER